MNGARRALTALPILTLALAGCGSSKPAATRQAAAPAGASFAAAADRVCASQNSREQALGPGLVNADIVPIGHLPRAARYLDRIVAIRTDGLATLVALADSAAPALRPAEQAFVHAWQQVVADYRAAALAAHAGDLARFRQAFDRVAPNGLPTGPDAQAMGRATAALRLRVCGTGQGL